MKILITGGTTFVSKFSAEYFVSKEPQDVFWGGYHAYFADLDGYYWEVAWGPDFQYDENGLLKF